nr:helicase C-terminal domain-containing protein [Candidatus Sigynarchaeota archaeon]
CSAVARFWGDIIHVTIDKTAYYHCFSREGDGKYSTSYAFEAVCLDPGLIGLKSMLDNVYASLSLSGTIVPEAYTAVCRIPANNTILKLGTPFSANQVKTVVLDGVSTSMGTRDSGMYLKYLQKIVEMATATPKNSAAFCASYTVLKGILDAGYESVIKSAGKIPLFEKAGMASSDNDELIAQYKEYSRVSNGSVLLGVTGGRNSEGQDFPGDEMNAVMIVGIPYATPTPRVKKKISYYDSVFENGKGWSLGYEIPAIQKANQACGRPIRTLNDRAVIVLADERFKREKILRLMSPWLLQDISSVKDSPGFLHASVSRFFKNA